MNNKANYNESNRLSPPKIAVDKCSVKRFSGLIASLLDIL